MFFIISFKCKANDLKVHSTRYDYRIRFAFWGMEMNADDSIPVDWVTTALKIYCLDIRSLDFIGQKANRMRQSYRVKWLKTRYDLNKPDLKRESVQRKKLVFQIKTKDPY